LPTDVRETAQLYLDGKIDQWYSLEDRPGVVFILNLAQSGHPNRTRQCLHSG